MCSLISRMKSALNDNKTADQTKLSGRSLSFRARVTNGAVLADYVDQRSEWARRFRDVIAEHEADLGGRETLSEAQRALVRRAALLQVELEFQESKFAVLREEGTEPSSWRLEDYGRHANTLRRLLETLGLHQGRRLTNVTPGRTTEATRRVLEALAGDHDD